MKRLVLFIVILITVAKVTAQRYEISVYTEPRFSWITSDESEIAYNGTALNLNAGIELDLFFAENYAFSLAVCMNNSGGKLLYNSASFFVQSGDTLDIPAGSPMKHGLNYVGIPLGLKLKSEELGYTTFYFHGGLIPMFRTSATTSSETLGYNRRNIKADVNLFNLNYFGEVGIEYRLGGNTALKCGVKWSAGLTDVTANDLATNNLSSIGLLLGVLF